MKRYTNPRILYFTTIPGRKKDMFRFAIKSNLVALFLCHDMAFVFTVLTSYQGFA